MMDMCNQNMSYNPYNLYPTILVSVAKPTKKFGKRNEGNCKIWDHLYWLGSDLRLKLKISPA